jgi:ribosome-binding protein aMBF1 (putative translation factor)
MADPELIREAIEASGLSARRFAERILARDERTVRRWVAGDTDIPPIARRWLEGWLALSKATRSRIIRELG